MIFQLLISASLAHTPAPPIEGIAWARAFSLDEATVYNHRADLAQVQRGWMVAVRVDPSQAIVRQVNQPVLYVGEWPLAILKRTKDGCVLGWIPSETLVDQPVFYGPTTLPERVTQSEAQETALRAPADAWRLSTDALAALVTEAPLEARIDDMLQTTHGASCGPAPKTPAP